MPTSAVHRLSAFTTEPEGGNPAGVVLAVEEPDAEWMQQIATEVGYSETAFLWPAGADRDWHVRYFSPVAEVPFCGHATIAAGALLAQQSGDAEHRFHTRAGEVPVEVSMGASGPRASLTSVDPAVLELPDGLVPAALGAFGWGEHHLAPQMAPALGFAGARHLLLPVRSRLVLAEMHYDFETLLALMLEHDLTTVAAVWQQSPSVWHARNAFAVGGVIEDPATGAAAAALGGWLRVTGQVLAPASITVHQGDDMGRPSLLEVTIPVTGGIVVAGTAVAIG